MKKLISATLFAATLASAGYLNLNSGVSYGIFGGPFTAGTGRGIGLYANSTVSITSIGIEGALNLESYDVLVFSSTNGSDVGGLLATNSAVVGGAFGFHDIAIGFTLTAGNYYVLGFRPTVSNPNWGNALQYWEDSGLPVTVGGLTLIDGTEGHGLQSFFNAVHPSLRVNTSVPEPSTWMLIGAGVSALGLLRRRS